MGVDVTTVLMYGIKLDWQKFQEKFKAAFEDREDFYDYLEDEINGAPGAKFDIILDSICGEYIVMGKTLKTLAEGDEDFEILEVSDLPNAEKLVTDINEKLLSNYSRSDFKLLFFHNYF